MSKEDPVRVIYTHYLNLIRSRLRRTSRNVRLAGALALFLTLTSSSYGTWRWWTKSSREIAQARTLLRKNSGLKGKDGSRIIFVPYKDVSKKVVIHPTKATTFDAHRRLFLNPPRAARMTSGAATPAFGPPAQTKPGLNLAFLHQFLSLLNIMIPRFRSKETGLLFSHGVFLILRTYLSLVVARLDGAIVRDLVAGNGKSFIFGILRWLSVGTLASYTNAMIKFLQSKISIAFRTRLTRYIHDLYLNTNLSYYKLSNLDGGVGEGADQFVTQDLTLFCNAAASLYSSLGKPLVDIFVFNYQLYRSLGPLALTGLLVNYFTTATLLRRLSPPFGKLKAVEGRKEGDFRGLHARLIANAEEVAFYGGADIEKVYLNKSFKELRAWMEGIYRVKIRYNMLEDFVLKYSWSAFGYVITSLPVFLPSWGGLAGLVEQNESQTGSTPTVSSVETKQHGRMKEFITNKRLMLSLADAGGRMMYSIKDLSELAGYTSRVYTLISTLHRVHANAYNTPSRYRSRRAIELYSLSDVQGTMQTAFDGVRMEDVPIVAPQPFPYGGDELIATLTFLVHTNQHLLISGSNGVGKSAIARILAGLWPVYRGLVSRPSAKGQDGIMFLPQRPYLSVGTLRDQVIYPHTELDMRESGRTDLDLQQVLDEAKLGYLVDREGGWNTRKEWKDVLSGGEKQRMGFARLFYHEPRYAVLDEATSAVSQDVEGYLYEMCKEKGMTVVTLSTRIGLRKYHEWNLKVGLDDEVGGGQGQSQGVEEGRSSDERVGNGGGGAVSSEEEIGEGKEWEMVRVGTREEKVGVERELAGLREKLGMVQEWERRKREVEVELGLVHVKSEAEEPAEGVGEEVRTTSTTLEAPAYLAEPSMDS